ncbi:MAG: hypothetical protein ACRCUS_03525 [Anaerovoracaceae bacterium]
MTKKNTIKAQITELVNHFYVDVMEDYKEASRRVQEESSPRGMFRKKDYYGNIEIFKKCKKDALFIDTSKIEPQEEDKEILERFERLLSMFNELCDIQIQLQTFFINKTKSKGAKWSQGKELMSKLNQQNMLTKVALHDVDVTYADYLEEE